ncbi:MAG: DUF3905 domain-containing protein [Alicyclobacillus herbarius]|uniref:DUF3905 domain-containing protein n=1 Tax=Alicyclobacillus herbarius TaxID=122960 RepID=UPI00041EC45B|nr:DUF3905 domain-containing protein [Alicyclobacillus herbarius]MCL6632653.1 DUF3905 domain-containing protein [Alicyclobacillus herbarius]
MSETTPTDGRKLPPWRETPLDHWSTDIDPVLMAGDEWVEDMEDPGTARAQSADGDPAAQFMHPTQDTNYRVAEDIWFHHEDE